MADYYTPRATTADAIPKFLLWARATYEPTIISLYSILYYIIVYLLHLQVRSASGPKTAETGEGTILYIYIYMYYNTLQHTIMYYKIL